MATYIPFPWDECLTLAAKLSPDNDLTALHQKLQRRFKPISRLPVASPMRQLLGTLQLRELFRTSLSFETHKDDLRYWMRLQGGCHLRDLTKAPKARVPAPS
jgi:hypothetical protein